MLFLFLLSSTIIFTVNCTSASQDLLPITCFIPFILLFRDLQALHSVLPFTGKTLEQCASDLPAVRPDFFFFFFLMRKDQFLQIFFYFHENLTAFDFLKLFFFLQLKACLYPDRKKIIITRSHTRTAPGHDTTLFHAPKSLLNNFAKTRTTYVTVILDETCSLTLWH